MPTTPRNLPHAHLSFDGHGINDRDEYRTRIATFARPASNPGDYDPAKEFGPLFAAAPDMREALGEMIAEARRLNRAAGETVFNPAALELALASVTRADMGKQP